MLEDVGCVQKLSDQVISIDFPPSFCDLNELLWPQHTGSLKNNAPGKNLLRASISRGLGWWFQWRNWKRSNLPTVSVRRSRFYPLALILDDPGVLIHDSKISKPSNPNDSKWFPKIGLPKSSTIHPQFIHNSMVGFPMTHPLRAMRPPPNVTTTENVRSIEVTATCGHFSGSVTFRKLLDEKYIYIFGQLEYVIIRKF